VPSITINAGNPPELYAVPDGHTLAASGGCPNYPCFNVAPCRGQRHEHACVKAIDPERVLAAVDAVVRARAWAASTTRGPASVPVAVPGRGYRDPASEIPGPIVRGPTTRSTRLRPPRAAGNPPRL
jgi:hypothetical protein